MRVFITILTDSLRLLRARALFWVTLGMSALVAVLFLSIGFTPTGISGLFGLLNWEQEMLRAGSPMAEAAYLWGFSTFVVGGWLSWVAVGLALISCASIFPDFMAEGSIGISLSKPVRRLTIFLYKYIGSLMFVTLQVGIFALIVFLAIRWRLGVWNASVFWAVPIVVLIFSYLYSVVVLVAVRTRSVLAAIFAAIVVWFVSWVGQKGEELLYSLAQSEVTEVAGKTSFKQWHEMSVWLMAALPKTGETADLLDRLIVAGGQRGIGQGAMIESMAGDEFGEAAEIDAAVGRHSTGYIVGTSLAFEAVLLGLAAWIFCRKDF
jgi:ABC-type transport system involved in multi-copper enzyme maturation permease subunit